MIGDGYTDFEAKFEGAADIFIGYKKFISILFSLKS